MNVYKIQEMHVLNSESSLNKKLTDEAIEWESKILLTELSSLKTVDNYITTITNTATLDKMREKIKTILRDCIEAGQLNVIAFTTEQIHAFGLAGYVLVFRHLDFEGTNVDYLHRIHVLKPYRGSGLGTQILKKVKENSPYLGLLCSEKNVAFFKRLGFKQHADFNGSFSEGFDKTKYLYAGAKVMSTGSNNEKKVKMSVFHLNDRDIHNILMMA